MDNFHFELNREGVKELLKSSQMQQICGEHAQKVLSRANGTTSDGGYEAENVVGANRCWSTVRASTPKAVASNLKHNTLLKALGGGS